MASDRYQPAVETSDPSPSAVTSELARRFWDRLRLFAARRLGNTAVAEDVAQEALRRVFQALREGRIANPGGLPGFVFQTARHICMHERRGFGRAARAFELLSASPASAGESAADPLARLLSEERRAGVRQAMGALDDDDRTLLLRLYVDEVEPAEVAGRLGISIAALRVRKHRALKRLAELMRRSAGGNVGGAAGT